MTDVLTSFNTGKLWDFKGGIHPAEMKSQSNGTPIGHIPLPSLFYVPVKQHAGSAGTILVTEGQNVLKGQALTQGNKNNTLPIHAPTSGKIIQITQHIAAHPSGLTELTIVIEADGKDEWCELESTEDWVRQTPEQLTEKIYQAGIAGLGGAAFPTASKIEGAENKVKLLIINAAECEPYITCDDRLMRDHPLEIIEGIRILRYILHPEKVVIAIEDNKPEALKALQKALQGANDIEIRIIPTKYPSGAAKQLIQVLTGLEIPKGQRSSSFGIYMQNVGTAFAIQRAIINGEPLIERVITMTGDKLSHKANIWARIGTPIAHLLQAMGYQFDERFPIFFGGPMMGFILHNLQAPITKMANCIIAPDHFEYAPPPQEQSCIRCSSCSDACPVRLMPQQMYWFARAEDHEKSQEYSLFDCIECGLCAYVCPSHIPLIQYFRQEKAKIIEIREKAKHSEQAKIRFEARQARLEKEKQARQMRTRNAAAQRREEIANQQGIDPVQAALERLKSKKAPEQVETPKEVKTITNIQGEILPDNADIMAQRKARRLARQAEQATLNNESLAENKSENPVKSAVENNTVSAPQESDPRKAAITAAIARAKAKKAQSNDVTVQSNGTTAQVNQTSEVENKAESPIENPTKSAVENSTISAPQESDPRKAAIAAAIARAKAKKAQNSNVTMQSNGATAQFNQTSEVENKIETLAKNAVENSTVSAPQESDPRKAAIAAAIARAKAKKAQNSDATAQASQISEVENKTENPAKSAVENSTVSASQENDPRKAAIAAAIARAKAKKAALVEKNNK